MCNPAESTQKVLCECPIMHCGSISYFVVLSMATKLPKAEAGILTHKRVKMFTSSPRWPSIGSVGTCNSGHCYTLYSSASSDDVTRVIFVVTEYSLSIVPIRIQATGRSLPLYHDSRPGPSPTGDPPKTQADSAAGPVTSSSLVKFQTVVLIGLQRGYPAVDVGPRVRTALDSQSTVHRALLFTQRYLIS